MATESTPATLSDLVPELHALILANLPYKHLLCAKRVAKNWKAIIESDPTLQVQTFKKASSVHIDNGVVEVDEYTIQRDSEPMTIHPALQEMCWHFGEAVSDARFYLGSNLDPYLASAGVLDDLATIPAVHTFKTTMREDMFSPVIFVQNDQGITVRDVLSRLAEAAQIPVAVDEDGKTILLCETMGDHIYYDGFESLTCTGTVLCAGLYFGS